MLSSVSSIPSFAFPVLLPLEYRETQSSDAILLLALPALIFSTLREGFGPKAFAKSHPYKSRWDDALDGAGYYQVALNGDV